MKTLRIRCKDENRQWQIIAIPEIEGMNTYRNIELADMMTGTDYYTGVNEITRVEYLEEDFFKLD